MNKIFDWPKKNSILKGKDLKGHVLRGTIWVILGQAVYMVLRLGSSLVLTRLLFPEAFGIMALVQVFMNGLHMFSDVGIGPAIIQNKMGEDPEFLNTAWTIQVIRGFALWGACLLLAWPIGRFYDEPSLALIFAITGLTAIIGGFNSTSFFTVNRKLKVGKLTVIELATQAIAIVVMIFWACINPTIWALIGGGFVSVIVKLVLGYLYLPSHSHTFRLEVHARKELFHFGKWIFLSTALTFLALQADKLFLGKMVGTAMLGIYSIASNLAMVPTEVMRKLGGRILFPALSFKVRKDGFSETTFYKAREPIVLITAVLSIVLIGTGKPLIEGLYDARYEDAGWMLSLLAIGGFIRGLQEPLRGILLAAGKSKGLAMGNAAKLLGILILFPVAARLGSLSFIIIAIILTDFLKYIAFIYSVYSLNLKVFRKDLSIFVGVALAAFLSLIIVSSLQRLSPELHQLIIAITASSITVVTFLSLYYFLTRIASRNKLLNGNIKKE